MVRPSRPSGALWATALFLALLISIRALLPTQREFGDGREYILQTQAIVFDRSLSIDPATRGEYWNRTNPFGINLPLAPAPPESLSSDFKIPRQRAPGFGGLYQARDSQYRFVHPWVYSLVASPLYALMHTIAPGAGEYLSFRLLNLILLFVTLTLLWRLRPTWWSLGFLTLVLTSPLTPHLQWAHSEIFCFSAVVFAFVAVKYPRLRCLAPMSLGLGAAQNIPIALLFPVLGWFMMRELKVSRLRDCSRIYLPYLLGIAMPLGMMAYYYHHFGVPSLLASVGGADTSLITVNRMLSVLCSPEIGVMWYFPAAWLAVLIAWRSPQRLMVMFTCISVFAVAALSASTTNINSSQLASPRYAVWFLAPLYVLPFLHAQHDNIGNRYRYLRRIAMATLLLFAILLWLRTYRLILGEWFEFHSLNRANSRVAKLYRATHFDDDIEPLVENIQMKELTVPLSFNGLYIWNISRSQSMWIISKRAWVKIKTLSITGDVTTLESSDRLREVFDLERAPSGSLRASPRPNVTFRTHRYWGPYLILWVNGIVSEVATPVRVVLKQE